ncbi:MULTISPECIES: OadG family protein [Flammeovirga]|uniref:OadG family protein n=1 Tax=Flammeovirga agarivorans TaxID=2726742 RepID=A0A7X8SLW8_9BACT|nr:MULTISPECIES: OadG family protein [Flammeovirga]NLR92625.1 OadG family protein [Flammeovirga agarivorans]
MEYTPLEIELSEGLVVSLVGVALVFLTLAALFIVFSYVLPFILRLIEAKPKVKDPEEKRLQKEREKIATGEVNAAIAAALYKYLGEEDHDEENTILTIQKVKKAYSPWSSKIYAVHGSQLNR